MESLEGVLNRINRWTGEGKLTQRLRSTTYNIYFTARRLTPLLVNKKFEINK